MGREKQRILYIDVLRVMATFGVILIHTSAQNWADTEISFWKWNAFNIWDAAVQWSVPVFIMISGILFLDGNRAFNIRKLYTHSIFRIVIAFIIWSFLYALYQVHIEGGGMARVMALTLEGHYHMWFLFMIVGLYILTPLLRKLGLNEMRYFLIVSYILCFIIPTITGIIDAVKQVTGETFAYRALGQLFVPYEKLISYIRIDYVFYYVLGYYLSLNPPDRKQKKIIYPAAITAYLFTVIFSAAITGFCGSRYNIYDIFTVNMSLEVIGVFTFVQSLMTAEKEYNSISEKLIVLISECSFGIYLVHALILEVMNNGFGINTLSFNPYLSVPVIAVFVFLAGFAITLIIKRIPVLRRYMV